MKHLILLLFIPSLLSAALSSSTVWEIRSAGADTAGGGFVTGASGTDYSQQDAAQYALTGVTTAGADAILLDASAAANMVGNIAQITGGTNFTVGFYEIVSVSVGVSITLDRTCTTAAGAAGVVNIGGALATIGKIGSATVGLGAVAGNTLWLKGSFTLTATDTVAFSGTNALPIKVKGYATTRGDGYQGRAANFGALVTTNMPTLAYNSTFRYNGTGGNIIFESLNLTGTVSGAVFACGSSSIIRACRFINVSTNAAAVSASTGTNGGVVVIDCDIELTGASGGTAALVTDGAGNRVLANRIKGGPAAGINWRNTVVIAGNLIFGSAGNHTATDSTSGPGTIIWNTFVGGGADAVQIQTASLTLHTVAFNMITDNTGYALDMTDDSNQALFAYNRTRDNTAGQTTGAATYVTATNWGNVTTDTGGASTDYTDAGTSNYTLITASPAAEAALQPPSSMGAIQLEGVAGAASQTSYGYAK